MGKAQKKAAKKVAGIAAIFGQRIIISIPALLVGVPVVYDLRLGLAPSKIASVIFRIVTILNLQRHHQN